MSGTGSREREIRFTGVPGTVSFQAGRVEYGRQGPGMWGLIGFPVVAGVTRTEHSSGGVEFLFGLPEEFPDGTGQV